MAPLLNIVSFATLFLASTVAAYKATVNTYAGPGCSYPLENFIGTCEGNCYKPVANGGSFDSMWLVGGTGTVRCHAFSDDNCQTELKDTGDVGTSGSCQASPQAKSVICYSGC